MKIQLSSDEKKHIIKNIALISLFILCIVLFSKNISTKHIAADNIKALTEQVNFYKDKNGKLVAEKTILVGDMNTLKQVNEDLAQQLKDMKVNKPDNVVYIETVIDNSTHDTAWQVEYIDTSFIREFDFSNEWRALAGNVNYQNKELKLNIDKDQVFANFTIAVKDNKAYVVSDNPYILYNDVQGLTLPKYKPMWAVTIGPYVGVGIDLNKKIVPNIGLGVSFGYSLCSFGRKY